jgi:predicted CopG family antitoxin
MKKQKKVGLSLTDESYKKLKELSEAYSISLSLIVRKLIDRKYDSYIAKYNNKNKDKHDEHKNI